MSGAGAVTEIGERGRISRGPPRCAIAVTDGAGVAADCRDPGRIAARGARNAAGRCASSDNQAEEGQTGSYWRPSSRRSAADRDGFSTESGTRERSLSDWNTCVALRGGC